MIFNLTYFPRTGSWQERRSGFLFLLDRASAKPGVDYSKIKDYMVVRRLPTHSTGFIIKEVLPEHLHVHHTGFQRIAGSGIRADIVGWSRSMNCAQFIVPGAIKDLAHIVDNTNVHYTGWKVPVYRNEVDALFAEPDFDPAAWTPNPKEGAIVQGWYERVRKEPKPSSCYIIPGDLRAAGTDDIQQHLIYPNGTRPSALQLAAFPVPEFA